MKKKEFILALIISLLLFFSIPPAPAAAQKKDLLITAGGVGGMFYVISAAFSEAITGTMPDVKTTIVPGGAHANPLRIQAGEADMGITYSVNARGAVDGIPPYPKKLDKVRAIANLNIPSIFNFMVVKDLAIKSFPELEKKKPQMVLCPGTRGMGGELATRRVLAEYGMGYEDIIKWKGKIHFSGWVEANNLIRDRHAHALSTVTQLGSSHVMELVQSREMVFFPVEEKVRDTLEKKFGYAKFLLKANTYKGLDEDLRTIADGTLLIASADMDADLVYKITKIICTNKEKFKTVHRAFLTFDPKLAPYNAQAPLHPGAERYYKEVGYLK